jgi:hypothetical protein
MEHLSLIRMNETFRTNLVAKDIPLFQYQLSLIIPIQECNQAKVALAGFKLLSELDTDALLEGISSISQPQSKAEAHQENIPSPNDFVFLRQLPRHVVTHHLLSRVQNPNVKLPHQIFEWDAMSYLLRGREGGELVWANCINTALEQFEQLQAGVSDPIQNALVQLLQLP